MRVAKRVYELELLSGAIRRWIYIFPMGIDFLLLLFPLRFSLETKDGCWVWEEIGKWWKTCRDGCFVEDCRYVYKKQQQQKRIYLFVQTLASSERNNDIN